MKARFLGVLLALASVACTTPLVEPTRSKVQASAQQAEELMKSAQGQNPFSMTKPSAVERVDGIWIPVRKASEVSSSNADMALKRHIVINRSFASIAEIAERITAHTGIPVSVAPDAVIGMAVPGQAVGGQNGMQVNGMPAPPRMPTPGAAPPITPGAPLPPIPGNTAQSQTGYLTQPTSVPFSYDGKVSGFLDLVAARYGVSWEVKGDSFSIFRYKTKTFRLVALPGEANLNNTISNESGTGGGAGAGATPGGGMPAGGTGISSSAGGGGAAASATGVTISAMSVYAAIKETLADMSSTKLYSVTPATGTVTVTDTPAIIDRIEKFIEGQNASLSKQVTFNVRVLAVDLNSEDQFGINWNALYNSLSRNFGFNLTSAFTPSPNATSMSFGVLGEPGSGTGDARINAWRGSQAIISALAAQGNVEQVTSASVTTMNNQPAPLQVGRQTAYLASSSTTLAQGAGSTTTLTPGLVTTGFSMSLMPHMLDKGKMLVQFAINISSLLNLAQITSNGATIQTPEIDTRNFMQRVMMNTGETLVLTGFEQMNNSAQLQGVGKPENIALGGGATARKNRVVLVILLQPVTSEI